MAAQKQAQGLGAPIPRKEDMRFLRGRGCFVGDVSIPGVREVAFVRSPIAHGILRGVPKPPGCEREVFLRTELENVRAIRSTLALPGFKPSSWPPLAEGKVRYVGE